MQPTAAALCAVCLAAPLALPNGGTLASAPGHDLTASAGAVKLAAAVSASSSALPAAPTLLEVLGLPIQTVNNIVAEGTTGALALPAGFPLTSAQYVSIYEALNAYIKVGSTVAVQLVNGQFESIAPSFQTNLAAAMTALQGVPASIAASLQYNLGVIGAFIATLGAPTPTAATTAAVEVKAAATSSALPANPTLLEVLGLPIQTVNNIVAEGTTGAQALPAGFPLTSAQYVSVFEALNAFIKVGSTIAVQLVNGQFESIPTSFQANLTAANTALMGLVPSVAASLQYNLDVIRNFFAAPNAAAPAAAADKTVAVSAATPTALPANPTLLEVLGLPIQTVNNIIAAGTTGALPLPTGFPLTAAQYVSVFNVLNAFIKIGSTVAVQLVNGQFEQIAPSFQTNLTAAATALQGFAPSVAASLQYNVGVIQNFFAAPNATATPAAAKTLAVSAATPTALPANPTLLEVLGLQIQTANNILAAGTTGAQALPPGFPLTAAQYVSVYNAANAYIKVGSTVAVQLVNGQFEQIAPSFQANLTAANTALQGLAPSIGASLQYDADVVRNFLTGGAATPTVNTAAVKANATPAALPAAVVADTPEKSTAAADSVTEPSKSESKVTPTKKAPTVGFLKQLQSAVDSEVGGGKVKVATQPDKPAKTSSESKASDSTTSDSAKSDSSKSDSSKSDSSKSDSTKSDSSKSDSSKSDSTAK